MQVSEERNAKQYKDKILAKATEAKEQIKSITETLENEKKAIKLFDEISFSSTLKTFDIELQGIYSTINKDLKINNESKYVEEDKEFLKVTVKDSIYQIEKPKLIEVPTSIEMIFTMNTARYWVETRTFQDMAMYMSISTKEIPSVTPSVLYILTIIHILRSKLYEDANIGSRDVEIINRFNFKYSTTDLFLRDFVDIKVPIANSYEGGKYQSVSDLYSSYLRELKERRMVTEATSILVKNVQEFISQVGSIDASKMIEDKYDSPVLRDFKLFIDSSQQAEEQLVEISDKISKTIPFSYYLDIRRYEKFNSLLDKANERGNKVLIESLINSLIKNIQSAPLNFQIDGLIEEFNNLPDLSRTKFINMLINKNKQRVFTLIDLVNLKKDLNSPEIEFDDTMALNVIRQNLKKSYQEMLEIYGNSGAEFQLILDEAKQLQKESLHRRDVDEKLKEYGLIMTQINNNFNGNRIAMENTNMEIVRLSNVVESSSMMMSNELRQIAKEQSSQLARQTIGLMSSIEKEISGINSNSEIMTRFLESVLSNVKEVNSEIRIYSQNMGSALQKIEKGQQDMKDFIFKNTKESEERQISFMRNIDQERMKSMQNLQEFQMDNRIALNNEKLKILSDQNINMNELSLQTQIGNIQFREEIERLQKMILGFPTNELTKHLQGVLQTLKTSYDGELLNVISHIGNTLNQHKEHINEFSREFQNFFSQTMAFVTSKIDTTQVTKQLEFFNKHIENTLKTSLNSMAERYNGELESVYRKLNERTTFMMKEDEKIENEISKKNSEQIRKIRETNLFNEINEMKEKMIASINEIDLPKEKIRDLSNKVDQLSAKIENIGELVNGVSKSFGPSNMNELLTDFLQIAEESENQPFSINEEISRVENMNDEKGLAAKALVNFKQSLMRIEKKIDKMETENVYNRRERSYINEPIVERRNIEQERIPKKPRKEWAFENRSMDNIMRESFVYQPPEPSYRMDSEEGVVETFMHAVALIGEFSIMAASLLNGKSDFGLEILNIIQEKTKLPNETIIRIKKMIAEDFDDIYEELEEVIKELIEKHASRDIDTSLRAYVRGWRIGAEQKSPELDELLKQYSRSSKT